MTAVLSCILRRVAYIIVLALVLGGVLLCTQALAQVRQDVHVLTRNQLQYLLHQRNPDPEADHTAPLVSGLRLDLFKEGWLPKRTFTLSGEVLDPLPGTGASSATVELMVLDAGAGSGQQGGERWKQISRIDLSRLSEIDGVVPFQAVLSVPADAHYRLRVIALDVAGNASAPAAANEIAFGVDTTAPVIQWEKPVWVDHRLTLTAHDAGVGLDPARALRMAQAWPVDYSMPVMPMKTACRRPDADDIATIVCTLEVPPGLMGEIIVNYLLTDKLNTPSSDMHMFQMRTPVEQTVSGRLSLQDAVPNAEGTADSSAMHRPPGGVAPSGEGSEGRHVLDGQHFLLRVDIAVKMAVGDFSIDYRLPAGLVLDGTAVAGPGDSATLSSGALAAWDGRTPLLAHSFFVGNKRIVIDIPVRSIVDIPMPRVGVARQSAYIAAAESMKGTLVSTLKWVADAVAPPQPQVAGVIAAFDLSDPVKIDVLDAVSGGYDTRVPARTNRNVLLCSSATDSSSGRCADHARSGRGAAESSIVLHFTETASGREADLTLRGVRLMRGIGGHALARQALDSQDNDGADAETRFSVWLDPEQLATLPGAGDWRATLVTRLQGGDGETVAEWRNAIVLTVSDRQHHWSPDTVLELHKEVSPATALPPGATMTYTISIHNRGPATLHALAIHDRAPASTVLLSAYCPEHIQIDCRVYLRPQTEGASSDAERCRMLGSGTGELRMLSGDVAALEQKAVEVASDGTVLWCLVGDILPGTAHAVTYSVRIDS